MWSKAVVGDEVWLDPNSEEARIARGTLTVSCMPALDVVTNIWQAGQMEVDVALKVAIKILYNSSVTYVLRSQCMDTCQERCAVIHSVVAEALLAAASSNRSQ